jgi:DNA (cytosine-5)-methyltransferase 1
MEQIGIFDSSERLKITKPIRLIELFAGIGAQAKSLERLDIDFEHYRVCEFDRYAITSYNAIHGTNFEATDITKWKGDDLGIVDTDKYTYVLTYSFPCQNLSIAGNQEGMAENSGTKSSLLWEVKRLLVETEKLPQILILENVPQIVSKKNIQEFNRWVEFLKNLGYTSNWKILNSKHYKVPQNRERCFMVSWLGDYSYDFPKAQPLKKVLRDILQDESEIDDKYYLSEKGINYVFKREGKYTQILDKNSPIAPSAITAVGNANWTGNFVKCEPVLVGGYGEKKSNGGTQWYQQDRVYSADTVAMSHCASITGGSYSYYVGDDLEVYDYYNHKKVGNEICGTITSSCSHNGSGTFLIKKPKSPIRKLTQKECFRLMDFDDEDYEKARKALNDKFYKGKDRSGSQLYKQAGNSIVVSVLEAIFKEML